MTELITQNIINAASACGVVLDADQLHVGGERAVMSPNKYVLTGTSTVTDKRVVMKCSNHPDGIAEMYSEHVILHTLQSLPFSEDLLAMPEELFYGSAHGYTVGVTEFIEQSTVFPAYSLQEQFFMALQALESQEAFHTTTLEHRAHVRAAFTAHTPEYYLESTQAFVEVIKVQFPQQATFLESLVSELQNNIALLRIYDGYLMHTDFVPHNFRIADDHIYLLDFSSFRLGNKYESWARFLNFMEVHSPDLAPLLRDYVLQDRGQEEAQVLRLMRIHKALFLLRFYCLNTQNTTGDMQTLAIERADLWLTIVQQLQHNTTTPRQLIEDYKVRRNTLRTETEKARQQEFTLL